MKLRFNKLTHQHNETQSKREVNNLPSKIECIPKEDNAYNHRYDNSYGLEHGNKNRPCLVQTPSSNTDLKCRANDSLGRFTDEDLDFKVKIRHRC